MTDETTVPLDLDAATVQEVAQRLEAHADYLREGPDGRQPPYYFQSASYDEDIRLVLAVVREREVKPDREEVGAVIRHVLKTRTTAHLGLSEYDLADAVLALLPGRTEAEVKAEAWDEAADWLAGMDDGRDTAQHRAGRDIIARLRDRAARLAAEGGADHG